MSWRDGDGCGPLAAPRPKLARSRRTDWGDYEPWPRLIAVSIIVFALMHAVPGGPFAPDERGRMAEATREAQYAKYGLDWQWVRDAVKETFTDDDRRDQLKESTNIFRVLIKTLLHAGIITQRTAPLYAVWVDMKELEAEGDGIPGDVVAEEMLVVLREINAKRKRIVSKDVAAAAAS